MGLLVTGPPRALLIQGPGGPRVLSVWLSPHRDLGKVAAEPKPGAAPDSRIVPRNCPTLSSSVGPEFSCPLIPGRLARLISFPVCPLVPSFTLSVFTALKALPDHLPLH